MTAEPTIEDATKFVADNYKGTRWATGCISRQDARFLYEMIIRERPKRMMEIGVASGVSTAFLSRVLSAPSPR